MTALIVGCSAAADRSLLDALATRFNDVRAVASPTEALELASRLIPELVITAFPVIDRSGESVTALLRRNPRTSTCRIIAFTDWCWARTRTKAREHGCDALVSAQAPVEDLLAEIDRLVQPSQSHTVSEAVRTELFD
jgi:CheY-like chemotaxis protein